MHLDLECWEYSIVQVVVIFINLRQLGLHITHYPLKLDIFWLYTRSYMYLKCHSWGYPRGMTSYFIFCFQMIYGSCSNWQFSGFTFLNLHWYKFTIWHQVWCWQINLWLQWGLNSRPLVYKISALPLSYRGLWIYATIFKIKYYVEWVHSLHTWSFTAYTWRIDTGQL